MPFSKGDDATMLKQQSENLVTCFVTFPVRKTYSTSQKLRDPLKSLVVVHHLTMNLATLYWVILFFKK